MAIEDLRNLLWNGAILSGGLSIVAHVIARQSWKQFQASLKADLTPDTGDLPNKREWDFRYWHRIGLWTARLSIVCSTVWLISKLIYL
ncbi:hypothetical protein DC522_12565 [Microvirga sp. KLBC 81]|nr:hypothetical protein DC522_12565 [Microvirga sp. KLBC 81]